MPREKVSRRPDEVEVTYSEEHWRLLEEKRSLAKKILRSLSKMGLAGIVHGSVARGDVRRDSDVDVVVLSPTPSYLVEYALLNSGFQIYYKKIVQATPAHTPKAYLVLEPQEKIMVSFPLVKLTRRETEFYFFGGALDLAGLEEGKRVPGVNKRLELIIPTEKGHISTSIIGRESWAANLLGISVDTVLERVRVLTRRDEIGRTGVYLNITLSPSESIEEAFEREVSRNPALRRTLRSRGEL